MDIHTLIRSEKDSISIPELRKMLGIGKTESYWLIQNRGIKTFQLRGCMRVRNKDFWDWYDNQTKHRLLQGPPPGRALQETSYSVRELTQRVNRKALDELEEKDVLVKFPTVSSMTSTILVLKTPKTTSSVRKVYMPSAVARMLVEWKQAQDEKIELLGAEYQNYDLVFAGSLGMPTEASTINDALHRLIKEHDLPPIVFHSLRHPYVKHTTKIFSLRLMDSQAQAYPDARRKTRGACQLHRGGQNRSSVRPLCNRKRFS